MNKYEVYTKIENKEAYLDSIYNLILSETNDSLQREELLQIATRYEGLDQVPKFKQTLYKAYDLAVKQTDTLHQAQVFWYLGDFYDQKQIADSSYYYFLKAEHLYASQQDSLNWARMLLYKAGVLYDIGIYTECETATAQALEILSKQNETRLLYEANVQMTLVLKELKEYKAVLKYYLKIPTLLLQLEREGYDKKRLQRSWLSYYNNIGDYYNEMNKPLEGRRHFEEALSQNTIDDFPKLKAMLLSNYAYNLMLSDLKSSKIDSLLDLSLTLRKEVNHVQGIINGKIYKAEFNLLKNDTLGAIIGMREAYELALANNSGYELMNSLKFLAEYDQMNTESYYVTYLELQDSLHNIERQTRNKFARIAYETSEIEKKNDILIKRNSYLWGITIVILSFSFIGFMAYHLQLKNKKLVYKQKELQVVQHIQELLLQKQEIANRVRDQERERIARDLHDGIVSNIHVLRSNLMLLPTSEPQKKIRLNKQLEEAEEQLRNLSHDMFKKLFKNNDNFSDIVKDLVLQQKNTFETNFVFIANNNIKWDYYSNNQKIQIYLILLELLHNVNKHSYASECKVILIEMAQSIIIRVCDNGVGLANGKVTRGMGFKNVHHRLKGLKGVFTISKLDDMTMMVIEVPYEKKNTNL
ncbi:sensor histidine kinase [Myroides pelagicus]|uniref:sensor histidine kinase n=1 Tax=Myroides pelagicus TaxID=270914 RepID=UPI001F046CDB|nr:histidine kinase [Myroides pelagicus]